MATALWKGMLHIGDIKPSDIYIYDPSPDRQTDCACHGLCVCRANRDVVEHSRFLFLCVKPQVVSSVLSELREADWRGKVLVSICAGVSMAALRSLLDRPELPVVRAMPNTPLLLGQGMTALAHDSLVSEEDFAAVRSLFDASGKTVVSGEDQLAAVTAVSGSGPSYCFQLARAVTQEGAALGLSPEVALTLFAQTLRGSAAMLEDSGRDADDLIRMVTSPKGTTLAANEVLQAGNFEPLVRRAVRACFDRAVELAAQ